MSDPTLKLARIEREESLQSLYDSLENLVTMLGTESDKRMHGRFVNKKMLSAAENRAEIEAMYRTDWLSGKAVDIIPDDMTRNWRRFITDDYDEVQVEELEEEERRLNVRGNFHEAHKWARLYGGCLIILAVDDGRRSDEPLDWDRVKKGSFRHMKVIDRHFCSPSETLIMDPMSPEFGLPVSYRLAESSIRIHHSRVIRFDGVQLPLEALRRNNYWSDSILDRMYNAILNANTILDSSATMVSDTNVDVIKVKGLMNYLATAEGTKKIHKRFALDNFLKSYINAHLIDAEGEEYSRESNTFTGLPDLTDRSLEVAVAAVDIPATRFLGRSAQGLNATGEGDLRNYYDRVSSDQEIHYRPKLDKVDKLMALNLGWDIEGKKLQFAFNPLYQMTQMEELEMQKRKAERDAFYWDRDIVPSSAIARDLVEQGVYENIPEEHIRHLESLEKLERENATDRDDPSIPRRPPSTEQEEAEGEEEEERAED